MTTMENTMEAAFLAGWEPSDDYATTEVLYREAVNYLIDLTR